MLALCCVRAVLRRVVASRRCVVTSRNLYFYQQKPCCCCLWGHEQKYIPLDKIQDITIHQSWLMGRFGVHKVVVETAGQGGPQTQPFSVTGMAEPVQFRQALLRARLAVAPAPAAPRGRWRSRPAAKCSACCSRSP